MANNALLDYLVDDGYDVIAVEPTEGGKGYWDVYLPEAVSDYYAGTVLPAALTEMRAADVTILDRRTRQQWTGDAR